METLVQWGIQNTVAAASLALLVLGVEVLWRRPAFAHALWIVVLLKLATPPLVTVPLLCLAVASVPGARPDPIPRETMREVATAAEAPGMGVARRKTDAFRVADGEASEDRAPGGDDPDRTLRTALTAPFAASVTEPQAGWRAGTTAAWIPPGILGAGVFWLAGTLGVLCLSIRRFLQFNRILKMARPAPEALIGDVDRLVEKLGLKRRPRVMMLAGLPSPVLWGAWRKPTILVPEELWDLLGDEERRSLLAHELAHYGRRDHLLRWLESLVTILYWWCPVVYLARRRLHRAEETCCDAWVVWAFPEARGSYGSALLKTVDFVCAEEKPILSRSAVGGETSDLRTMQRRLAMIMKQSVPRSMSRVSLITVLAIAALALPLVPVYLGGPATRAADSPRGDSAAAANEGDEVTDPDGRKQLTFDDFDGKLNLQWTILGSQPSHVSMAKRPGTLTITTQRGSLHGRRTDAKNIFLVKNPAAGADFVVTTKVDGFRPASPWNHAGLICYMDNDNYLRWGYTWNQFDNRPSLHLHPEVDGVDMVSLWKAYIDTAPFEQSVWLRMERRGERYSLLSSTDGKAYELRRELTWAGKAEFLGVEAVNGPSDGPELDASFDFFEFSTQPATGPATVGGEREWQPLPQSRPIVEPPVLAPEGSAREPSIPPALQASRAPKTLAFDEFDGKLSLDWTVLGSQPSHVSLAKNPGKLTITTQRGWLHYRNTSAKNVFLLENPAAGRDFVVTTRLEAFRPERHWNMAGLVCYQDKDNFLMWVYVWNRFTGRPDLHVYQEVDGLPTIPYRSRYMDAAPFRATVWLRLEKKGERYSLLASSDGESYKNYRELTWAGKVGFLGLEAINGNADAPEIDASFDFFEVFTVPAAAPSGVEEKKGTVPPVGGTRL
jgi:beta-lactamase regulating signal transducer with metallopeptidase domain/beta-xylosidase